MNGYQKSSAKAVVWVLFKNFGNRPVLIDPKGKHWVPLRLAEKFGWCKWDGERCWLTPEGVAIASEFVVPDAVATVAEAAD